jgi:hypothetical protein
MWVESLATLGGAWLFLYPVPWARDASASFLLSESDTRAALERAGYKAVLWRDDTQAAGDWFRTVMSSQPPSSPNLALVMGRTPHS